MDTYSFGISQITITINIEKNDWFFSENTKGNEELGSLAQPLFKCNFVPCPHPINTETNLAVPKWKKYWDPLIIDIFVYKKGLSGRIKRATKINDPLRVPELHD